MKESLRHFIVKQQQKPTWGLGKLKVTNFIVIRGYHKRNPGLKLIKS